jgi:hypothetical protein
MNNPIVAAVITKATNGQRGRREEGGPRKK